MRETPVPGTGVSKARADASLRNTSTWYRCFTLGGIGSAVGFCDWLAGVGGAGFSVMVVGAAQAIFNAFTALFAGEWLPACVVLGVFVVLTVFGLLAGFAYRAMHSTAPSKAVEAS